ncbi:MAG: magnesium transporter [Breznakibacter sp.]|jgi:magnesium transporter|nr:magnesium transporter [Breznakibacter sp.]
MANFELTREFISKIRFHVAKNDEAGIRDLVKDLHPADIADVFRELTLHDSKEVYLHLDDEMGAEVLSELPEEKRNMLLDILPNDVLAKRLINNMDSDDAADLIGELDEERRIEVLSLVEDVNVAGDIVDLLNYSEDTAGGLMDKELIKVKVGWTIPLCIRSLRRQAADVDRVYYVYVIDNSGVLKGTLSLKSLILANNNVKVEDIYNSDIISVPVSMPAEETANIMDKYGLIALPVVDDIGRLVGKITIDDVLTVIRTEAEEDYQLASGLTEVVESSDGVFLHTRARIPWLLIGLLGGILGSRVVGGFMGVIALHPELAFFMGLIAAMGGNVGIQSSAIVVQSLASGTMGLENDWRKLLKELLVALLNASILSLLIFGYNYVIGAELALTLTVSAAMFSVVIFASMFGSIIPLLLKRINIDPAVATGPFVTTMNDILGMFIYLTLGTLFFTYFVAH